MSFDFKDLLAIKDLSKKNLQTILYSTQCCKQILMSGEKTPILVDKNVAILFYEPSTRTKNSFEIAAKRLSANVINISVNTSSVVKGESITDTVKTLEAMRIDYIIIRHSSAGIANMLAKNFKVSIINAGDGFHEHPTQGLLDLYTIYEYKKKIKDLKVLIVGDILHSRVAKSNIWALKTMGAEVFVSGPPTFIPANIEELGVTVFHNLDDIIDKVDVVNILRIQSERQKENLLPSLREYISLYQLNKKRLLNLKSEAIIMHPGPINRGIEIDSEVADSSKSVINKQVTNGIAVRMSILSLLNRDK
ncbi:MAG: aspartate carbamoyltransferase catalytic subunit [Endomicrobium sp.]|jgi:aspartate carbamoyltransferase catalytic subunit|nr:aspartate carbamoyltransferase catalytic subunit [Endomicrobium sp.]